MSLGKYYIPYISDESESDTSESDSEYTSASSVCSSPVHRPVYTSGPANVELNQTIDVPKFETVESRNTFLFTINSRDRDTRVYAQPTFFTIRLPRVLRNVKQINITQINLLNSFFNFTVEKGNTFMHVLEKDRTRQENGVDISNSVKINIRTGTYNADDLVLELTNALNTTPLFADLTFAAFVNTFRSTGNFNVLFNPPGAITFNSLTQSYDRNQTIANIVSRYFQIIQTVGVTNFSDNECTIAYYYPIIKEMIIAQQFPVPFDVEGIDIPPGFTTSFDYIVFAFQGLNDPYILQICEKPGNIAIFDNYHTQNTFNQFLANKYTCTYNVRQGRLVISAPSLNDSIVSDLNNAYNNFLGNLIIQNNFTSIADFNNKYNAIQNSNGTLTEFYNFIQRNFAIHFGVNFGKYGDLFYANSNNEIDIYNTLDRYGWITSPQLNQLQIQSNPPPPESFTLLSNILLPFDVITSSFVSTVTVPQFSGMSNTTLEFANSGQNTFGFTDISFAVLPTSYINAYFESRCRQNISLMTIPRYSDARNPATNERYDISPSSTPFLYNIVDSNTFYIRSDISGNLLFNMYDITAIMLTSAEYMRDENRWLDSIAPQILSGTRVQSDDLNFNQSPPLGDIALTSVRPYIFFQLNADEFLVSPDAHYEINFHIESQDSLPFPVPIVITWYKDRNAFMSDAQNALNNSQFVENPRHYFKRQVFSNTNRAIMTIDVNNNQQTFFYVHLGGTILPNNIALRTFAILKNAYGEYEPSTFLDTRSLPYANLSSLTNQFTPAADIYKDPTLSIFDTNITQIGYDISGVSNNLLDYVIHAGSSNYYDPGNLLDYTSISRDGFRYLFVNRTNGANTPSPNISSPQTWSLYFGTGSCNEIRDTYNTTNNIYLSSLQILKPLPVGKTNEFLLANWFDPSNNTVKEEYLQPAPDSSLINRISTTSVFLPCVNPTSPLITDVVTDHSYLDSNGVCGISFFMPPNAIVKLDKFLMKFVYTQPSHNELNVQTFTRCNSPIFSGMGVRFNNTIYRTQVTSTRVHNSPINDWDDWYLYNRRNMKIGIFRTSDISGVSTIDLSLSSAFLTMSLESVRQVNNHQNRVGTKRTRDPEWGTYYCYSFQSSPTLKWDVANVNATSSISSISHWRIANVDADRGPAFTTCDACFSNYFYTANEIHNYTYLPRSYGIAPSVGTAVNIPYSNVSSYTADIEHSFTAVPFYSNATLSTYTVGSFYGLSYTRTPSMPSISTIGAAPYYGPPGIFAWTTNPATSTIQLFNGDKPTFQPYYWNTKIEFEQLDEQYNPATDLALFGGFCNITEELQDTVMFLYNNLSNSSNDVLTQTSNWKWGLESNINYVATDDRNGYNFLSYIHNTPVRPNNTYSVHVRSYSPAVSFTSGIRFIGKNYTDFGNPTLIEIAYEISSLGGYVPISDSNANALLTSPSTFVSTIDNNNFFRETAFITNTYADALIRFDKSFSTIQTFGQKLGFAGVTFPLSGYSNALISYIDYRAQTVDALQLYNQILSTATGQLNEYVVLRYSNILPKSVLLRNRVTDPLPFSLLFESKTPAPFKELQDEWGLGWNLGFLKKDTIPRTTITSDTFIRITQDYIYLRLNPELNINTLAVSGKENFADTRDSVAQDNKYFSKILLANFGGFSRAAVQLPKLFNPVLGKYESITCQLVDKFGNQLNNTDCDYDFVLECTEINQGPKDSSSLMSPQIKQDVLQKKT